MLVNPTEPHRYRRETTRPPTRSPPGTHGIVLRTEHIGASQQVRGATCGPRRGAIRKVSGVNRATSSNIEQERATSSIF